MVDGNLWQGLLGLLAACFVASLTFGKMIEALGTALRRNSDNRSARVAVIALCVIIGACWMAVALFVFNAVAVLLGAHAGAGELLLSLLAMGFLGVVGLLMAWWVKRQEKPE